MRLGVCLLLTALHVVGAWLSSHSSSISTLRSRIRSSPSILNAIRTPKNSFLDSLDKFNSLNTATPERTKLLNQLIENKITVPAEKVLASSSERNDNGASLSIKDPGLWDSMMPVAPGNWKVIYAPHMTTMANLAGGRLDVQYLLRQDGTTESHATCDFAWLPGNPVTLSVSGTYASVSDDVCRVDFDQAWYRTNSETPYASLSDVPDSLDKSVVAAIGRLLFLEQFSVFPISFLDEDLVVFDFELLGTRICARKIDKN